MQQTYFCANCQTEVSYSQSFCHNCGAILNWMQPAHPPPYGQQNLNQQQPLWTQPQPYNQPYPYNRSPAWGNQNQYQEQDSYGEPATKSKKQKVSDFAVYVIASLFILLMAGAVVFATNGNIFANTLAEQPTSSTSSSASASPLEQVGDAYKQALVSPLNKAGAEITDPSMASFYQRLVEAYELNKTSEDSSSDEGGLASLIPDLKKIIGAALNTSFVEVGKQIKDSEIADFYNSFIQRIGAHQ